MLIAAVKGKSMKRVVIKVHKVLSTQRLKWLKEELNKQWCEGFMLLPSDCTLEFVDQEWIPVEQGLPKEGVKVLAFVESERNLDITRQCAIGWIDDGSWMVWLDEEGAEQTDVLAWMPLPLPYEG